MRKKLTFAVERRDYANSFAVHVGEVDATGRITAEAVNVVFNERPDGDGCYVDAEPLLVVDPATMQRLMDEMWRAGVRPSGKRETESERAAYLAHIADLRAISMRLVGIKK